MSEEMFATLCKISSLELGKEVVDCAEFRSLLADAFGYLVLSKIEMGRKQILEEDVFALFGTFFIAGYLKGTSDSQRPVLKFVLPEEGEE